MSEPTKPVVHQEHREPDQASDLVVDPAPPSPREKAHAKAAFVTATHAVLFAETDSDRCDVCADPLTTESDDDGEGFDVRGRGLLVWSRGDERRYQEPPLCSACAAAIGVSALQRWEIEEEEG